MSLISEMLPYYLKAQPPLKHTLFCLFFYTYFNCVCVSHSLVLSCCLDSDGITQTFEHTPVCMRLIMHTHRTTHKPSETRLSTAGVFLTHTLLCLLVFAVQSFTFTPAGTVHLSHLFETHPFFLHLSYFSFTQSSYSSHDSLAGLQTMPT